MAAISPRQKLNPAVAPVMAKRRKKPLWRLVPSAFDQTNQPSRPGLMQAK